MQNGTPCPLLLAITARHHPTSSHFWDEVRKGKMQSLILKFVVLGYIGVTAYAVHVYSWPLAAATALLTIVFTLEANEADDAR
jgi:hypothetical protein